MYNSNILRFDGINKTIVSQVETISLLDIYSQWKRWVLQSDNAKFLPAFSYNSNKIELMNGWVILIK
jgi:hypothetical protein